VVKQIRVLINLSYLLSSPKSKKFLRELPPCGSMLRNLQVTTFLP